MTATTTLTLAAFVLARVDELYTAALNAHADWPKVANAAAAEAGPNVGWHVLFNSPARVLAECEAVRRIVEVHADNGFGEFCLTCVDLECLDEQADYPCPTLRILAAAWADHDLYREEWRP